MPEVIPQASNNIQEKIENNGQNQDTKINSIKNIETLKLENIEPDEQQEFELQNVENLEEIKQTHEIQLDPMSPTSNDFRSDDLTTPLFNGSPKMIENKTEHTIPEVNEGKIQLSYNI